MPALTLQTSEHYLGCKAHVGISAKYFKPLCAASPGCLVSVSGEPLHSGRSRNSQKLACASINTARKGVIGKGIADFHRRAARHQSGKQGDCKDDKRASHGYNLLLPA